MDTEICIYRNTEICKHRFLYFCLAPRLIPAHVRNTLPQLSSTSPGPAHPRSRGEHVRLWLLSMPLPGSSPLTRGTLICESAREDSPGLIPAHAGNTLSGACPVLMWWAHPRSRGEHTQGTGKMPARVGSSPLTRGTPTPGNGCHRRSGLIPAHAGNTIGGTPPHRGHRAHPRSRGEHTLGSSAAGCHRGSSPLTRGTRYLTSTFPWIFGLIPAHAGNTLSGACPVLMWWAHPRSRGEHLFANRLERIARGSSPLTRGTRSQLTGPIDRWRLIPAHAGNTPRGSRGANSPAAHPRSRGEHLSKIPTFRLLGGSSPLTRGTLLRPAPCIFGCRLIPAHAGNTRRCRKRAPGRPAHPRSRGEHRSGQIQGSPEHGSSPLTRGTPAGGC